MSFLPLKNPAAFVNSTLNILSELNYNINAIIMASAPTDSYGNSIDLNMAHYIEPPPKWYTIGNSMKNILDTATLKGIGFFGDDTESLKFYFTIKYFNNYQTQENINVGVVDITLLVSETDNIFLSYMDDENPDGTRYNKLNEILQQIQVLQDAYTSMLNT